MKSALPLQVQIIYERRATAFKCSFNEGKGVNSPLSIVFKKWSYE
jgi:hypothetical protein